MKPSYPIPPRPSLSQPRPSLTPSLARTSYSSSGTGGNSRQFTGIDERRNSSGTSVHWENSDIRGDVDAGWGSAGAAGTAGASIGGAGAAARGGLGGYEHMAPEWGWSLHAKAIRHLPPFYPLDPRSTRKLYLQSGWANEGVGGVGGVGSLKMSPTVIPPLKEVNEEELSQSVSDAVDDAIKLLQKYEDVAAGEAAQLDVGSLKVDMKMLKMDAGMLQSDKDMVKVMSDRWKEVDAKMIQSLKSSQKTNDACNNIMNEWREVDAKASKSLEEFERSRKGEESEAESPGMNADESEIVPATSAPPTAAPPPPPPPTPLGVTRLHNIHDISNRISSACQHLSIQANWDNMCPSATLFTMERVEMVISMYLGGIDDGYMMMGGNKEGLPPQQHSPQVLLIEVQRRKGCTVTFHNYRRTLLDAAEGKFNPESFHRTDGLEKPKGRDRSNKPKATLLSDRPRPALSRPTLRPPSFSADDAQVFAQLKSEGDSFESSANSGDNALSRDQETQNDIVDKALVALNIAASLIKKDRVDARRLGIESLVLLTDPLRAGVETAKIASRVVLLGTAREDMVWSSNDMNVGFGNEDDVDALFDESAGLGIRESILEMIMGDDFAGKSSSDDIHAHEEIDKEFNDSFFNSCLSVLSNALNTLAGNGVGPSASVSSVASAPNRVEEDDDDGDDRKPSPSNRRRAATEPAVRPSSDRNVSKRFIDDTNSTFGVDVLSSLIRILGQARQNPHDAYHSARCLGVLFKGCGNSHKARARRDLDAKRIISAALEVGSRSHAKLADASRAAMVALITDDEESVEEEEGKTELEYDDGIEAAGSATLGEDEEMETEEEHQHHELPPSFRPPGSDVL